MTKINSYNLSGKVQAVDFPKELTEKENNMLLAQAVRVYEDRIHPGLSKVQTRGEIDMTTKKVYKQKGTGGARHGAKSAPIFVGGGIAHGPKGVKRILSLPKKVAKKSLKIALSVKANLGEVVFLSETTTIKSTKEAAKMLKLICKNENIKLGRKFVVAFPTLKDEKIRFFRNIEGVTCASLDSLNARDILYGGLLAIDSRCFTSGKVKEEKVQKTAVKTKKIIVKKVSKKVKKEVKKS